MPKLPKFFITARPVIVARISKEKIVRGWSLEAQVAECRSWCEKHLSVSVADEDVQIEDGVSGRKRKLEHRPGLFAAVQGARDGIYSHIIFHAVDRGARNLGIMCQILDEMQELGVVVISAVDNQRSDTASGKSFFQMVAMMAQWQAERTSEQIEAMQRARRQSGLPNGPLSFGAITVNGKPVPDLRPVAIPSGQTTNHAGLLLAFKLRAENHSDREIASALNEAGYRTAGVHEGNLWSGSSVRYMLHNRFYIGDIPTTPLEYARRSQTNVQYVKGDYEPLIPLELWEEAQSVNRARSVRRQSIPHGSKSYSLGGGIVKCLSCLAKGEPAAFQIYQTRRKESWHGSLICGNRVRRDRCDQPSAPLRILEQQIEWCLHDLVLPLEDMSTLIEQYKIYQQINHPQQDVEGELKRLEARLERQTKLYEMGDWTEERYFKERASLMPEIERLRKLAFPLQATQLYDLSDYLKDLSLAWRAAQPDQKQQMVELLFQDIYVQDRRIVAVRPTQNFSPLFSLITSAPAQWQFANYVDETLKVYFLGGLGVLRGIVPSV
ncbi:MAG: recombinase family protein [Ktedonobacterales bacterium]|nr:recombinase family protein [Ktedonobacterales bacterium]